MSKRPTVRHMKPDRHTPAAPLRAASTRKRLPSVLLAIVSLMIAPGCEGEAPKIFSQLQQEDDPRELTYAEWKRETDAGRGDSLMRKLTADEIDAIRLGILSHKGDTAAVAVLTMRELIDLGRTVRKGASSTGSSGRTQ